MTPSHRAPPSQIPKQWRGARGSPAGGVRRESGRRAIFRYFTYFLERSRASYVSVLTTTETDQPRAARGWSVVSTLTTLSMSGSRSLTGHRTATAHRARGLTHSSGGGGGRGGPGRGRRLRLRPGWSAGWVSPLSDALPARTARAQSRIRDSFSASGWRTARHRRTATVRCAHTRKAVL